MLLLSKLLEELKSLRDDFSEEIPDKEVHGTLKYKVQSNWFQLVSGWVYSGINLKIINDEEIINKYWELSKYYEDASIWSRRKNNIDIEKGNELLNLVIKYCEKKE